MLECPYPLNRRHIPSSSLSVADVRKLNDALFSPERVQRIALRLQKVPKLWSEVCKGQRDIGVYHYNRNAHQP